MCIVFLCALFTWYLTAVRITDLGRAHSGSLNSPCVCHSILIFIGAAGFLALLHARKPITIGSAAFVLLAATGFAVFGLFRTICSDGGCAPALPVWLDLVVYIFAVNVLAGLIYVALGSLLSCCLRRRIGRLSEYEIAAEIGTALRSRAS